MFFLFNNPISSSICKLPIGSEIYNCTFKTQIKFPLLLLLRLTSFEINSQEISIRFFIGNCLISLAIIRNIVSSSQGLQNIALNTLWTSSFIMSLSLCFCDFSVLFRFLL